MPPFSASRFLPTRMALPGGGVAREAEFLDSGARSLGVISIYSVFMELGIVCALVGSPPLVAQEAQNSTLRLWRLSSLIFSTWDVPPFSPSRPLPTRMALRWHSSFAPRFFSRKSCRRFSRHGFCRLGWLSLEGGSPERQNSWILVPDLWA